MAERGQVDSAAPVRTHVQVSIRARPDVVWAVLSDIAHWPSWQPDIQKTVVAGPLVAGTAFLWTTPGSTIHSRIELVQPGLRLAWTGHLLVFHAVHVWKLAALPNGDTELTTDETLSGWPITLFYSSEDLRQADERWINALRTEAERRALLQVDTQQHSQ